MKKLIMYQCQYCDFMTKNPAINMNHEMICNLKPKSDLTKKSLSRNYPKCEYLFYKNGVYSCRNKNKCDNTQRCLMCKVNKK